jgi:hypothetical protein
MQNLTTTTTTTFTDDATTERLMATMSAFMAADLVDDIAFSVAQELALADAHDAAANQRFAVSGANQNNPTQRAA